MSKARERHAMFYVEYAKAHPGDWRWFETEWLQVSQAWKTACNLSDLALDYVDVMAELMKARGLWWDLIHWHQKAIDIVRQKKNREAEAQFLNNIGLCYQKVGDTLKALETYESALLVCREIGDKCGEIQTAIGIGRSFYQSGELERALVIYQQAIALVREIQDIYQERIALNDMGIIYKTLGNIEKAMELYNRSLEIARHLEDKTGQAACLNNLGCLYMNINRPDLAESCFR